MPHTGFPQTTAEPLLLSYGLRPFPGLVDVRGRAVPRGPLRDRMREILTDVAEAGYQISRPEPGADFQDFWEDAIRISTITRALAATGQPWVKAPADQTWDAGTTARRLGPVFKLEEHHRRDRLITHPLMADPHVTGRRIHTATYHDEYTLADLASDQISYITSPDELAEVDPRYAGDFITRLRAGLTAGLTDSEDPRITINAHGVGCNAAEVYVNSVFALRDFCWCEGRFHPEVNGYADMDDNAHYAAMSASGGTSTGCPPNFEHFASGITGTWYKHLGRDTQFNRYAVPGEALEILRDCLASLPAGHPHRVREDAATRAAWGWRA